MPEPSAVSSVEDLPALVDLAPGVTRGLGSVTHGARWRPGLTTGCRHTELFASATQASGAGLALALARDALRSARPDPVADTPDERGWLWVQDKAAQRLSGRPCYAGLPRELAHRLIHVAAQTPEDALFAIEEGLRCRDLAFVIGEIAGNPRALDFTASRRLSLAAERHGVPLWLVRIDARRDLGSARMRWEVDSAPSTVPRWNPQAPGQPAWRADLFRSHTFPPGQWTLRDDGQRLLADSPDALEQPLSTRAGRPPHLGDLVRASRHRPLAAGAVGS
ncbi:hypothetical protein [Novosphingobium sp. FKTRR1]|uniref:hypothetical protein n=1 Tax=Novosphingobium sp. FKTRR1 TaxID=2879118 RepID=UPI001CF04626|nr:hypothetical protein [Novosphingobium sp. FKTRR1]